MSVDVLEKLERVVDRESFLVFLRTLMEDRVDEVEKEKASPSSHWGPGHNGWENGTIEAYLEAAIAWAETDLGKEVAGSETWKSFAKILYAAKIYE